MYSEYQRKKALQLYDECKSVVKTIQKLGYPSRQRMYNWIADRNDSPKPKFLRKRFNNTPDHPYHPPLALKLETIHRWGGADVFLDLKRPTPFGEQIH
jgi:hypothetical protein